MFRETTYITVISTALSLLSANACELNDQDAADSTQRGAGVKVGVLDSLVDKNHDAFSGNAPTTVDCRALVASNLNQDVAQVHGTEVTSRLCGMDGTTSLGLAQKASVTNIAMTPAAEGNGDMDLLLETLRERNITLINISGALSWFFKVDDFFKLMDYIKSVDGLCVIASGNDGRYQKNYPTSSQIAQDCCQDQKYLSACDKIGSGNQSILAHMALYRSEAEQESDLRHLLFVSNVCDATQTSVTAHYAQDLNLFRNIVDEAHINTVAPEIIKTINHALIEAQLGLNYFENQIKKTIKALYVPNLRSLEQQNSFLIAHAGQFSQIFGKEYTPLATQIALLDQQIEKSTQNRAHITAEQIANYRKKKLEEIEKTIQKAYYEFINQKNERSLAKANDATLDHFFASIDDESLKKLEGLLGINDLKSHSGPIRDYLQKLLKKRATVFSQTDNRYGLTGHSNRAGDYADHTICALGHDVRVAIPMDDDGQLYKKDSGTSFAAPYVTGAIAVLMADKGITAAAAKQCILRSANDLGDSYIFGAGLLNVTRALETS